MNKKIILVVALVVSMLYSQAGFSQAFSQGAMNVSVGYGFGTITGALLSVFEGNDNYKRTILGPIYGKFEYAITDNTGVGLNVAFFRPSVSYTETDGIDTWTEKATFTTMSILARFNYHLGESDHFDPYLGMGFGYRTGKWKYESSNPLFPVTPSTSTPFPIGFETTFGMRFLFTENLGVYTEIGIAKSIIQFGATAKF